MADTSPAASRLYPTHDAAEEAIRTMMAVLPEVLCGIMVEEHQRWLDGHPRTEAEAFAPIFQRHLEEFFARHGDAIELPGMLGPEEYAEWQAFKRTSIYAEPDLHE